MAHFWYTVSWDNGNHACGEFPTRYETEEAAENAGKDWVVDMCAGEDFTSESDDCPYSFEVNENECEGCEKCCSGNCTGCAYCYESNDPRDMGWVDDRGRP